MDSHLAEFVHIIQLNKYNAHRDNNSKTSSELDLSRGRTLKSITIYTMTDFSLSLIILNKDALDKY